MYLALWHIFDQGVLEKKIIAPGDHKLNVVPQNLRCEKSMLKQDFSLQNENWT